MKAIDELKEMAHAAGDAEVINKVCQVEEKINAVIAFLETQESGIASIVLKMLEPGEKPKEQPEVLPDFYHIYGRPKGGIRRKIGSCIEDNLNHEITRLDVLYNSNEDGVMWEVYAEIKRKNGKIVS